MADKPESQNNKKNKFTSLSSSNGGEHYQILEKIASQKSFKSGSVQQVYNEKASNFYLYKELKNIYETLFFSEYEHKSHRILNSILGENHPLFGRQTIIFDSVSTHINSDYFFSKKLNTEIFALTGEWKDILIKRILNSTLWGFNQPDLQISDIEEKIENILNEEKTLLENEEFTTELREKFNKEFSSTYKLVECIEKESTFLFYRLIHKYGLSVQAARSLVNIVMWISGIFIGVLGKELMTQKKENHKPNITHNHSHNKTINNYSIKNIDTIIVKTTVYRRKSDKSKIHATIPQDSIVSIFKQKGKYSLIETTIDTINERRIIRGWIKTDSLKNSISN